MYNVLPGEVEVASDNLLHEATDLVLCKSTLDEFIEISLAELSDDVGIVFGSVDLMD